MRCRGMDAFMLLGEEFEYEKAALKKKKVDQGSNVSDEEGTLAQAYTRFDNDENPDQFDELGSDDIQNDLFTDVGTRRFNALSSEKSKQRRVFYSPSQRLNMNEIQPSQILTDNQSEPNTDKTQSGSR